MVRGVTSFWRWKIIIKESIGLQRIMIHGIHS